MKWYTLFSMKIIFLNTWGGKIKENIAHFIGEHIHDTDIFCFQEVYPEMRMLAKELLPQHEEIAVYKDMQGEDYDFF